MKQLLFWKLSRGVPESKVIKVKASFNAEVVKDQERLGLEPGGAESKGTQK